MKKVLILGPGCTKCEKLKKNAELAVQQAGVDATVEKVTDINMFVEYGVMMTPALLIDGQVKLVGRVASVEEIQKLLK